MSALEWVGTIALTLVVVFAFLWSIGLVGVEAEIVREEEDK